MTKRENSIFESLLFGGIIGTTLGSLISKSNKGEGSLIGAIAGAAILASIKANENARKTHIPLVMEENDALYELYPDGSKKLIKYLPKSPKILPSKFTLK